MDFSMVTDKAGFLRMSRFMASVLLAGIVVRLLLIPITSSPFDVAAGWVAVIDEIYAGNSLYDADLYKYTPIWGYILSFMSYILNSLGMESFGEMFTSIYQGRELTFGYGYITNLEFNFLIKMPAFIFDILAAFSFHKLVMDLTGDRRKSEIAFALWFLCPVVIMSSAILCMFDSIMIFFMIESIVYFRRKNYMFAGVLLALSILTKAFSAVLLPIMVMYILFEHGTEISRRLRKLASAMVGFLAVVFVTYIGPLMSGEFEDSLWFLTSRSSSYSSGGGFSITAIDFSNIFFYMPAIIAIALLACVIMAYAKEDRDRTFLILAVVMTTLMFCFPFVSYTPTYGIVLTVPIVLLYVLKGRVALIPWVLTIMFVLHGIAHYWETFFYPLAAFTDLVDIGAIVEDMGNGTVYHLILLFMSSAGFVIMMLVLYYYVLPRVKGFIEARRVAHGD